ncbi:MAG TPA: hypothetical protein PLX18_11425 [Anaerohalosphaeraceae bacterium]|nr:hypothetical protein [Anaerohalosphaeraceae bacterium]HQG06855.1 hypothetical protein [Anaerohalosphaeraceae bacterium]HQI08452.1 hypothetical protein [Anaerohalosphaeraceae bacterium]HQJ68771.1 hypothetical protein [Anaerohalosphaeraceae bacterium]
MQMGKKEKRVLVLRETAAGLRKVWRRIPLHRQALLAAALDLLKDSLDCGQIDFLEQFFGQDKPGKRKVWTSISISQEVEEAIRRIQRRAPLHRQAVLAAAVYLLGDRVEKGQIDFVKKFLLSRSEPAEDEGSGGSVNPPDPSYL